MTKPRSSRRTGGRTTKLAAQLPMWQEAAAFSARAHRHQLRKDARTPYASHPFRVAMTVTQVFGCDEEAVIAAALLHDTIEDTTTDYEDLLGRFGKPVADWVAALTKNMALPEDEREEEYHARMARADWRVRLIKLADVYDNYSDLQNWPAEKQKDKAKEMRDRCRKAMKMAAPDMGRPAISRAVSAITALIGRE